MASVALESLFRYLDGLRGKALLTDLAVELGRFDIGCDDVANYLYFSERHYARNLVRAGDWYYLLVLCWKNGQRSPIHDHAGSACGVRVLRGTLTETKFAFAPNGHVKATDSADFHPGSIIVNEDFDVHQVSNLQDGNADLVTLHVYSPPLANMGTYSITDKTRGAEPLLTEFIDAAGI